MCNNRAIRDFNTAAQLDLIEFRSRALSNYDLCNARLGQWNRQFNNNLLAGAEMKIKALPYFLFQDRDALIFERFAKLDELGALGRNSQRRDDHVSALVNQLFY